MKQKVDKLRQYICQLEKPKFTNKSLVFTRLGYEPFRFVFVFGAWALWNRLHAVLVLCAVVFMLACLLVCLLCVRLYGMRCSWQEMRNAACSQTWNKKALRTMHRGIRNNCRTNFYSMHCTIKKPENGLGAIWGMGLLGHPTGHRSTCSLDLVLPSIRNSMF